MKIPLETDRLIIRPWHLEQDINFAFAIYGDPEVMRLIRPPAPDIETLKTTLTKRIEEAEQLPKGGGFWAVVEKLTDEVIGGAILQPLPERNHQLTEDYEIGWQLRQQSWGKGYATEFGKTLMEYGFKTLQLPYLLAVVHPENGRSQRVTQRLGMTPLGLTEPYYGGVKVLLFKRDNRGVTSDMIAQNLS